MIAIVDYGLGNIKAFANIYKQINVPFIIARTASDFNDATKIILPGVGAFDHAMQKFNASGMRGRVEELVLVQKRPLIGICVGMQILAAGSDEGNEKGLDWIHGFVRGLDASKIKFKTRLPHMGWNDVHRRKESPLFQGMKDRNEFYFLHSNYFDCEDDSSVMATADYGSEFAAIINHENIFGIQCHPEKSHEVGVSILRNFAEL
jgi:glutamine amidotransferase